MVSRTMAPQLTPRMPTSTGNFWLRIDDTFMATKTANSQWHLVFGLVRSGVTVLHLT